MNYSISEADHAVFTKNRKDYFSDRIACKFSCAKIADGCLADKNNGRVLFVKALARRCRKVVRGGL